jgi:hypothetical protein
VTLYQKTVNLDAGEDIEILEIPLKEITAKIRNGKTTIHGSRRTAHAGKRPVFALSSFAAAGRSWDIPALNLSG